MTSEMHVNGISKKAGHDQPRQLDAADYFTFLVPCVQFIQFDLVGVLNASDILLMIAFVYLTFRWKIRIKSSLGKQVLILGLLWLASQMITDMVRHTAFADYARGWSNIGLTIADFCVLSTLLYGRPRRLVLFGWGLVASGLIRLLILPDPVQLQYPWKFGLSFPVSLAIALLASSRKCRGKWPIVLMTTIGVVNIGLDARNAGAVCLGAALYLGITGSLRRRTIDGVRVRFGTFVVVAAMLVLGIAGILWTYQFAARSGLIGEDAKEKFELQSSGRFGVLLGGREELLATIPAIVDSPVIGHGSWAKDPTYLLAMKQALFLLGYHGALNLSPEDLAEGLIPSHSFLFGAWVYSGFLGAVFWAWVWLMIIRSLARIYPEPAVLLPFMAYVSFLLLWDILFSPFGLDRRTQVPFYLLMIITYFDMAKRSAMQVAFARGNVRLTPALSSGD